MRLHFKVTFAQNNEPIGRKTGETRNSASAFAFAFAFAFWRLLSKKPEKTFLPSIKLLINKLSFERFSR